MKPIRMKVKHLIGLSMVILLLVCFGAGWLAWALDAYNGIVPEEFRVEWSAPSGNPLINENRRLERLLTEQEYNLYDLVWIEDGAISSSGHIRQVDAKKVYAQYCAFRASGLTDGHPDYLLNVALVMWFSGLEGETEEILRDFPVTQVPQRMMDQYNLIQTGIALTRHDLTEVDARLERLTEADYRSLGDRISCFVETFFKEEEHISSAEATGSLGDDRFIRYFNTLLNTLSYYEAQSDHESLDGQPVTIRVMDSGVPLQGVFLFADGDVGMSSFDGFNQAVIVTDQDGKANVTVPEGSAYRIGLIIPWHIVHDAQWLSNAPYGPETEVVSFSFSSGVAFESLEIVDGMLRYTLSDSLAKNDRTYRIKIRSTNPDYSVNASLIEYPIIPSGLQGEIPLEDLIQNTTGTFSNGDPSVSIQLEDVLEPLYLSDEYFFEIYPVEADRSQFYWNGLFSDALSYPLVVDGQEDLSEGDRLLAQGRFEDAIDSYEKEGSQHALKTLVGLMTYGYEPNNAPMPSHWKREGADPVKAAVYLARLIEKYGETPKRMSDMASLYKEIGDYRNEQTILQHLLDIDKKQGIETVYTEMRIAQSLINQGEFTKGVAYYHAVGDFVMDGKRYLAYGLLGDLQEYLPEDVRLLAEQVEWTEDYSAFHEMIIDGDYTDAWNDLRQRADSDAKTFYTLLMLDRLSIGGIDFEEFAGELGTDASRGFISYYVNQARNMQEGPLKTLLVRLKDGMNWFD